MTTCLLAIDTATDQLAVAVCAPSGSWWRNAPGGALGSSDLLPLVIRLLAEAGLQMRDLDAVAFGAGPGAFTGLRTACAVAQGLAFGAGKPVVPIDSLMLVAEDARLHSPSAADADGDWWVAVDARMDEVYAAHYRHHPEPEPAQAQAQAQDQDQDQDQERGPAGPPVHRHGPDQGDPQAQPGWQVLEPPRLYTWPALAEVWRARPPRQVAGNACTVFADRLPLAGASCQPQQHDRAAALLRLAQQGWRLGAAVDAADALPIYLRDKVALTTAERALHAAGR